jgi:hypothetical protein
MSLCSLCEPSRRPSAITCNCYDNTKKFKLATTAGDTGVPLHMRWLRPPPPDWPIPSLCACGGARPTGN